MRYSVKRTLTVDKNPCECPICGKTFTIRGLGSHIKQVHNPNFVTQKRGPKIGNIPWNLGLTKETDVRIRQESERRKGRNGTFTGRKHTEETIRKISLARSVNNKGGRCKWFNVDGQNVQGTWERSIAEKLTSLGIKWIKLKTNKDTFVYEMDGKTRSYTPDFFIPEHDVYLEIKGYWWGNDRQKMDIVIKTYPKIKFIIIEKDEFNKIMEGELVW